MSETAGREVSVLVTSDRANLGLVGPFPVESPHWNHVEPIAAHLRATLGVPTVILRLLDVQGGGEGRHGHTTYHAEALQLPLPTPSLAALPPAPSALQQAALRPHEHRADWATATGVRSALAWAQAELSAAGRPGTGAVEQVKTWNLAGLFRIPTATGPVWLKTGPRFAVCEASVIGLFASVEQEFMPTVLASDPARHRLLLDHVPGDDCWGPSAEVVADTIPRLARAQAALAARYPSAPAGLPDRSPRILVQQVHALLDGPPIAGLTADELSQARRMADQLPTLVSKLEECGLPNTVLHGDFHPGNWRREGQRTVVVDFADSHFGHPAVDGLRPRAFTSPERWAQASEAWISTWRALIPGSDPTGALSLAEPLAHLAYAVRYMEFLDNIEPSEHRYHADDPAAEIRAALAAG